MGAALAYLGWSGFRIIRADGSALFLDPPAGAAIPGDRPVVILITHGHPEHLSGARAWLDQRGGTGPATICAPPAVCRHLARRSRGGDVTVRPVRPGERVRLDDGLEVTAFSWRHLPLLPPGIGPSLTHLARLASRPRLAARIARAGLTGPRPGPMLGFRLTVDGERVLAYGEGLHRRCPHDEVAHMARGFEAGILLAAVEPEDTAYLPSLIAATGMQRVLLYEPHARWRDAFKMPRADMAALASSLRDAGIETAIARPLRRGAGAHA